MTLRLSRALHIFIIMGLSLSLMGLSYAESRAASGSLYIAHRGWSSKAPENSLAAITLAAKNKSFYGVEFDIWESSSESSEDPLLLVMDDENIKRMCGVSSNIRTMYLKKSLPADKCGSMAKKLKKAGIDCISLKYTTVSKKHIKRFYKSGIKICAWTIPNKKKAHKYARMGVDYITANGAVY